MRRLPTILAGTFVAITLARVAALANGALGAGWLGWPFAIGLGAGVYLCSYWLKVADDKTRVAALVSLVFFALSDLVFNTSEVYRGMLADGTWGDWLLRLAGIVYAAFPTLAVGLLGWLQGRVDRLPPTPVRKGAILPRIRFWLAAQIDGNLPECAVSSAAQQIIIPESAGQLPEDRRHVATWRNLSDEDRRQVASLSTDEVQRLFGVSDRTARNWRAKAARSEVIQRGERHD